MMCGIDVGQAKYGDDTDTGLWVRRDARRAARRNTMLQASPSTLPSITDLLTRGKQAAMSGQRRTKRASRRQAWWLDESIFKLIE